MQEICDKFNAFHEEFTREQYYSPYKKKVEPKSIKFIISNKRQVKTHHIKKLVTFSYTKSFNLPTDKKMLEKINGKKTKIIDYKRNRKTSDQTRWTIFYKKHLIKITESQPKCYYFTIKALEKSYEIKKWLERMFLEIDKKFVSIFNSNIRNRRLTRAEERLEKLQNEIKSNTDKSNTDKNNTNKSEIDIICEFTRLEMKNPDSWFF